MSKKRLSACLDAHSFFVVGESFSYTILVVQRLPPLERGPAVHGTTVAHAFSLEVYLKVLAQLERDGPPLGGHSLKDLFEDLSPESYQRAKRYWDREFAIYLGPLPPGFPEYPVKTFEEAVEQSSEAFMRWRYDLAKGLTPGGFFLSGLQNELREMIFDYHPEWRPTEGPLSALNRKA